MPIPYLRCSKHIETRMKSLLWQMTPADESLVSQLHGVLRIDPVFCTLLTQRGITTLEAAQLFFRPKWEDLHDPFLMKDMDKAVHRLQQARQREERILLYGDYDVDGTTSVAMMYRFLSGFHPHIDYYLPDRDKEGYGVSMEGMEYAKAQNCTLIIAMDCGIKAHAAVDLARSYGIDFIICDHHLPEGGLPNAVANLDPKRPDCDYPYKELSGCGISFKLAQAFALYHNMPAEELSALLDLVAVSIACDIVPMTGENRVLAHLGLQCLNRNPSIGLWALMQRTNRPMPLNINDLVFAVGPMINAAGRLGDARDAVRLMLSADRNSALDYAGRLVHRNKERREVDHNVAREAVDRVVSEPGMELKKSIVLFNPDWHKGIIGIAASRMAEKFHRPSVILTKSNGRAVGSARSVPGFDLYAALQSCEDLFYSYGGHAHAAGMQMPVENVDAFAERFEMTVQEQMSEEAANPLLEICSLLPLEAITPKFWKMLKRFEPFGPHNRNPVFYATDVVDTGHSRILENNHVRFSLRSSLGKTVFGGIGFGMAEIFQAVKGRPFDIAFNIREEYWRGERGISLQVKDIRQKK